MNKYKKEIEEQGKNLKEKESQIKEYIKKIDNFLAKENTLKESYEKKLEE